MGVETFQDRKLMLWVAVPVAVDVINRRVGLYHTDERTSCHKKNLSK
jgi:hypothetical protein